MTAGPVDARPAATVVLLRPGPAGLEVLLTQRPTTMAFASDAHVFPGGRVDPDDAAPGLAGRSVRSAADASLALGGDLEPPVALAAYLAAIRELFEEAGVLLADDDRIARRRSRRRRSALLARRDDLPGACRRARPAAAHRPARAALAVGDAASPTRAGSMPGSSRPPCPTGRRRPSKAARSPPTPGCARPMRSPRWPRAGSTLWLPDEHDPPAARARGIPRRDPRAPGARAARRGRDETVDDAIVRIVMPAGGGVAGQPVCAYLVGRRRFVLVDPGDPTGPGARPGAGPRRGARRSDRGRRPDPRRPGPRGGCRGRRRAPRHPGPGRARWRPAAAVRGPRGRRPGRRSRPATSPCAPSTRPARDRTTWPSSSGDGRFVLAGDLDGVRGARSVPAPPDEAAWAASRERLARLAPGATWLAGHPTPDTPG